MLARLRSRRPSHVTVVAYLALFVALSTGGAYASHLVVNSSDVVDESLTGVDVKGKARTSTTAAVNGSLTTDDIAGQQAHAATGTPFIDGNLTQWDIKNNSVTGSDVLESSLGKVPDADRLDGKDATQLSPASGDGRTADLVLDSPQDQTVLTANITTSGPSALLASAALQVNGDGGNNDVVSCVLRFDGTSESVRYATVIPDAFFEWSSLAVVWARPVAAGAHTVELRCFRVVGSVTVDDAGLIVSAHP